MTLSNWIENTDLPKGAPAELKARALAWRRAEQVAAWGAVAGSATGLLLWLAGAHFVLFGFAQVLGYAALLIAAEPALIERHREHAAQGGGFVLICAGLGWMWGGPFDQWAFGAATAFLAALPFLHRRAERARVHYLSARGGASRAPLAPEAEG